jgi:two-component system, NarL family, response regulator LiaR
MITVMLVDDHSLVREGLKIFLETEPDLQVIGEAANGDEAAALAGR